MNIKKIAAVMLISVLMMHCFSNDIYAADYLPNGNEIPEYPEEIYGKDYVLMYRGVGEIWLYILPDDGSIVKMQDYTNPGGDSYGYGGNEVINYTFPSGTLFFKYTYSTSYWNNMGSSNLSGTVTPEVYIVNSSVDIYYSGDTSIVYFPKNCSKATKGGITFKFIKEPESTTDMIYNLLLMDSMAVVTYIGYRSIKCIFARIRRFRNWKGERKC